jgi:hypothetical protein
MTEKDSYGTVKALDAITVESGGPFVASTPSPDHPAPAAVKAYNATMRRELTARKTEREAEG